MSDEVEVDMIEEVDVPRVWAALVEAWSLLKPHLPSSATGGHFCLARHSYVEPSRLAPVTLMQAVIGRVSLYEFNRYVGTLGYAVSQLWRGSLQSTRHRSKRPETDDQTAAIRCARPEESCDLVLAFAGLSEDVCEALMLLTAVQMRWLREEDAGEIAITSTNAVFAAGIVAHRALASFSNPIGA